MAPRAAALPKDRVLGLDELNFAEFPITLLSPRPPAGIKTIAYRDEIEDGSKGTRVCRELVITGSDRYGLPTALDDDVIVGLIQLSKRQNNFADPEVEFTRYDLVRTIRWDGSGKSYDRAEEAINRWLGVTLYYSMAWRDREKQEWVKDGFHILERARVVDREYLRYLRSEGKGANAVCSVRWNDYVFRSLKAGYVKPLDLDLYFGLSTPTAKRLYRYLDKWLSRGRTRFDLRTLACEKVGLSQKYDAAQLRRKLHRAVQELVERRFLRDMPEDRRYTKLGRNRWDVLFFPGSNFEEGDEPAPDPLVEGLKGFGVNPFIASMLVLEKDPEHIRRWLRALPWMLKHEPGQIKSKAGYLVWAIRNDVPVPAGFLEAESRSGAEQVKGEERLVRTRCAEDDRVAREQFDTYWSDLAPQDKSRLIAEARVWAGLTPEMQLFGESHIKLLVRGYLQENRR